MVSDGDSANRTRERAAQIAMRIRNTRSAAQKEPGWTSASRGVLMPPPDSSLLVLTPICNTTL